MAGQSSPAGQRGRARSLRLPETKLDRTPDHLAWTPCRLMTLFAAQQLTPCGMDSKEHLKAAEATLRPATRTIGRRAWEPAGLARERGGAAAHARAASRSRHRAALRAGRRRPPQCSRNTPGRRGRRSLAHLLPRRCIRDVETFTPHTWLHPYSVNMGACASGQCV